MELRWYGPHTSPLRYNSVSNEIVVNMVTPVAIETIGWKYYLVFLIISAIVVPIVFLFYPETMGRSLEELEMMFTEGRSIAAIVRESRKPLDGPLLSEHDIVKGEKNVEEDEYAV